MEFPFWADFSQKIFKLDVRGLQGRRGKATKMPFTAARKWGRFRSSKDTSMVSGASVVVKGEVKLNRF